MAYRADKQARIEAGFCFDCGKPRAGVGGTKMRCAGCSEAARGRAREWQAKKVAAESEAEKAARLARDRETRGNLREARRQARRCSGCGRQLTGREIVQKVERCAACQKAGRERSAASRRRKRLLHSPWAGYRKGEPLPMGRAVRVGTARYYCIYMDTGALRALRELKRRDREARQKRAVDGKVEVIFQTSRVVREAVRSWADISECPTRLASYREMIEATFTFAADAKTAAAVERHKVARGGNLSATICDLLVATAARPQWTEKPTARRISAGGGSVDPWDDE